MARTYIHERASWPSFTWDSKSFAPLLSRVRLRQGLLLGKMQSYGLVPRWAATLKVLTEETIKSSAIEGVMLDAENVRSSLARQLGLDIGGLKDHRDRKVDGVVQMMLDATQKFSEPLTKERLFDWHAYLFPGVRTTSDRFRIGACHDKPGPMQVVSGPIGRHKVHYVAPAADRVEKEIENFLKWAGQRRAGRSASESSDSTLVVRHNPSI
jgi:Fic family protein